MPWKGNPALFCRGFDSRVLRQTINNDMKLNELKGIKDDLVYQLLRDSDTLYEFSQSLRQNGFDGEKLIGAGYYAMVFARPSDQYVLKIFENDPGYLHFLKFVKNSSSNIHLPKIKGRPIRLNKRFTMIRIERLEHANDSQLDYNYVIKQYSRELRRDILDSDNRYILKAEYPELLDTIDTLYQSIKNTNINLDLHEENVLYRGNIPVITDPFSA